MNDAHASSWLGDGRTLCGVAEEGDGETNADPTRPTYAAPGELVTCCDCRRVIDHCRKFRAYREPRT